MMMLSFLHLFWPDQSIPTASLSLSLSLSHTLTHLHTWSFTIRVPVSLVCKQCKCVKGGVCVMMMFPAEAVQQASAGCADVCPEEPGEQRLQTP